jgi:acetolactate synthase-1/2/3 large subunit
MKKTGAKILVDTLLAEGVEVLFGYPGGAVIPLFDVLYDEKVRFILTRHEQGAAHMADGYARATGKVGVCIATSGPGATNLTTGIATANFDSVPVVAITGQVKTHLIGNDAFQEADVTGIMRPITKHTELVKDVADLARTIREAFHIARTGRPGPVVVDVPVDVTTAKWDGDVPGEVDLPGYKPRYEGNVRQVKRTAEAIAKAKQPLIYAGGGVIISGCHQELKALADKADIPVTTTLMGLGGFPSEDALSLGMLGMHGTAYANYAVQNADLILAVGARFDDRITGRVDRFAPHAKMVHIDIDPASISKNIKVDIPVVGDARLVLQELLKHVEPAEHAAWRKRIDDWKAKHPLRYGEGDGLKPQYVVEQIWEATKGEAIICTEVGQNQMWAAQFYRYRTPRTWISSGGLGTMGFGLPAALGAQVGCPDRVVFDIAGDGSIQMNIQELATAVHNKLPVKVAILNNGYLGMVRQWQELFYDKRYSQTQLNGNPDFVKLAEAFGAAGLRIEKTKEVRPAIEKALEIDGPVVMDFVVEPEENVFPMVPAGEAIDRMIGGMA